MPKKQNQSRKKPLDVNNIQPGSSNVKQTVKTEVKRDATVTSPVVTAEEKEQDYDFSSLKRETEEIAKLSNKKYANREIKSNWAKYDIETVPDEPQDEQALQTDFSFLVSTTGLDCSRFQLNSEKNWEKKSSNQLAEHNIFNLNLQILSAGLECIPFYEQVGLCESELSVEDVARCKVSAAESVLKYEALLTKLQSSTVTPIPATQTPAGHARPVQEEKKPLFIDKLCNDVAINAETVSDHAPSEEDICVPADDVLVQNSVPATSQETVKSPSLNFKGVPFLVTPTQTKDSENLEDWLDSVLDD